MAQHPLDADGARAGADIPEHLPLARREAGQGDGADLALGDLPVMLETPVRQPAGKRQDAGAGRGLDLQRQQVQRIDRPGRPVLGAEAPPALARSAQGFQQVHPRRAEAMPAQEAGDRSGRGGIGGQDQHPRARLQRRAQHLQRTAAERDRRHLLHRPAEPRAGQGERGRRGQRQELLRRNQPRQAGAGAEQERIARGQHCDRLAAQRHQLRPAFRERAAPGMRLAPDQWRRQRQVPPPAEDMRGTGQQAAGGGGQPLHPILAEPDDAKPPHHGRPLADANPAPGRQHRGLGAGHRAGGGRALRPVS
ncbi:hypothetical protein ROTAS13_04743 [Roseomonas sp. TAS13]|nr:hypothetical protein ROTAS13_04743 [Roseomonas sp. TAS13]